MTNNYNTKNYIEQSKLQWLIIIKIFTYKYNKTKSKILNNLIEEKKPPRVIKIRKEKNYIQREEKKLGLKL